MQNGGVPHSVVVVKNQEGYLSCRSPLRSKEFQPHTTSPSPGSQCREVPITSGCKNQQGLWLSETEDYWSPRHFLLKDSCPELLGLIPSELQCCGSSSKGTSNVWGGTELCGIRSRTGGAAFSQTELLAEAIVAFLSLSSQSQQADTIPKSPSAWLTRFTVPKTFPVAFPYKWPLLAHATDFPKISQTSSLWPQMICS